MNNEKHSPVGWGPSRRQSIWKSVMYDSRLINSELYGIYVSLLGGEIILDKF